MSNIETYQELLDIIDKQGTLIEKLINENAELENALNVMCREII